MAVILIAAGAGLALGFVLGLALCWADGPGQASADLTAAAKGMPCGEKENFGWKMLSLGREYILFIL